MGHWEYGRMRPEASERRRESVAGGALAPVRCRTRPEMESWEKDAI